VWICSYRNGHIQAVGDDAAGGRQYLYHQKWQQERNEAKFDRVIRKVARVRRSPQATTASNPPAANDYSPELKNVLRGLHQC
jgi:DNA topoisomerase IB